MPTEQKRQDFALRGVNNAFVHAATTATKLMDLAITTTSKEDIRQQVVDLAVDCLKITAHGTQLLHTIRKDNVSHVWKSGLQKYMCNKNATVEDINNTHYLFGGELQAGAKKGIPLFRIISWLHVCHALCGSTTGVFYYSQRSPRVFQKPFFRPRQRQWQPPFPTYTAIPASATRELFPPTWQIPQSALSTVAKPVRQCANMERSPNQVQLQGQESKTR